MRNRTRAQRRNAARQAKNLAARQCGEAQPTPKLARARYVTQLQLLLSRGNITERQYESGDRLYRDWRTSGSEPRVVPAYDRELGLGGDGYAEHQIEARQRFEMSLQKIGQRLSPVVVHVCLLDLRISDWRPKLLIQERMTMLRDGLDLLTAWQDRSRRRGALDFAQTESVLVW